MPTVQEFVPGSPDGVLRLADQVQATAQRAEDAQHELYSVVTHGSDLPWEGSQADAFRVMVSGLPDDLGLMASSYFRAAEALRAYGDFVGDAQRRATAAVNRFQEAETERSSAESARAVVWTQLRSVNVELAASHAEAAALAVAGVATTAVAGVDPLAAQRAAIAQRQADLSSAHARLTAEQSRWTSTIHAATGRRDDAMRQLRRLGDERTEHERSCAQRIRVAVEGELRNRSFMNQIASAVQDVFVAGGLLAFGSGLVGANMTADLRKALVIYDIGRLAKDFTLPLALGEAGVGRVLHAATGEWPGMFFRGTGRLGGVISAGGRETLFKRLPFLDIAITGAEYLTHRADGDEAGMDKMVGKGVMQVGIAGGALVAGASAVVAGEAVAAFGLGWTIGEGIDWATERVTGESLSDRVGDAMHQQAFGDLEKRSNELADIHRGMSSEDLRRRADEQSRISAEIHERSERLQRPITSILHGHLPW